MTMETGVLFILPKTWGRWEGSFSINRIDWWTSRGRLLRRSKFWLILVSVFVEWVLNKTETSQIYSYCAFTENCAFTKKYLYINLLPSKQLLISKTSWCFPQDVVETKKMFTEKKSTYVSVSSKSNLYLTNIYLTNIYVRILKNVSKTNPRCFN